MIEKYEFNNFLNPAFSGFMIAQFLKEFSKKISMELNQYIFFLFYLSLYTLNLDIY